MEKRLSFQIAPDFKNVDRVRTALGRFLSENYRGPEAASRTDEISLAATEAMNNAVEHSGADQVEIEVFADEAMVVFQIITKGKQFDPTMPVSMPVLGDGKELQEGGFGLAIIRELVDDLKYRYVEGKNIMTFFKKIKDKNG